MAAELATLRAAADKLIQSNPLLPETWDVDLSACLPIAQAHLHRWSADVGDLSVALCEHVLTHRQSRNRADRRARGKRGMGVWKSNKWAGGTFIMDSRLETMAIRNLRKEMQGVNQLTNAIANTCANVFLSRTSAPFYYGEPSAYPFIEQNDAAISSRVKDIWAYLRESSGSLNNGIMADIKNLMHYFSVPVRVALFVESGLVEQANGETFVRKVYPHGVYVPIFQRGNPGTQAGLGASLHTLGDPADKLHLAAMACRGAFSGLFTWDRFNTALVQGGWPWLRQYSRAYARMIYTVMVLIFAAIECYKLDDMDAMRERILSLAGKLVGNPSRGPSPWRIRKAIYLTGPKVTMPVSSVAYASVSLLRSPAGAGTDRKQNVKVAANGEAEPPAKISEHTVTAVPWSELPQPPEPLPQPLPTHVVSGTACAHTDAGPFSGRVKMAHSLADLEQTTADGDSITVALTCGADSARYEVCAWVLQRAMMTVQKAEGQCVGCAVNLAHCVGALVVIC